LTYSLKEVKTDQLYIDPFTSKVAIFKDQKSALITSMMLMDQQNREFKVIEN